MLDMRWAFFGMALGFLLAGCLVSDSPRPAHKSESAQIVAVKEHDKGKVLETFWQKANSDPTALFTLWVALFTGALAVSTIGLWAVTYLALRHAREDAARQSRDMKATIQLGRDEFNATHRPRIRLKHVWIDENLLPNEPIVLNLYLVNNGSADAILGEIGIRYDFVPTDGRLPTNPNINAVANGNGARLKSGLNYSFLKLNTAHIVSVEEFDALTEDRCDLYCIGYVSYYDAVGEIRITGFCRRLQFERRSVIRPDNTRFVPVKDSEYDYTD